MAQFVSLAWLSIHRACRSCGPADSAQREPVVETASRWGDGNGADDAGGKQHELVAICWWSFAVLQRRDSAIGGRPVA